MPRIAKLKELPKKLLKITEENKYKVQLGDIFTFSIEKGKWMYGRVVCIDPVLDIGGDNSPGKYVLINIYTYISNSKCSIPNLKKQNLLCKPFCLNYEIWMWGYFETLKNEQITDDNTFNPICLQYANDNYYNEKIIINMIYIIDLHQ